MSLKRLKLDDNVSALTGPEALSLLNPVTDKEGPIKIEIPVRTDAEPDGKEVFSVTTAPGKVENFKLDKITVRTRDNRPFRSALSKSYMLEFLRSMWQANGEAVILADVGGAEEVVNGQHRLIGFLWAIAQYIRRPTYFAKKFGVKTLGDLRLKTLVVVGCPKDAIDTLDGGQKRSGSDVMFRRNLFKQLGVPAGEAKLRQLLSNAFAVALRLVWLRAGGKQVSDAPKFPTSEMLTYMRQHKRLVEFVKWAYDLDAEKEGNNIRQFLSIGYAAALCYLMSTSSSETGGNGKLELSFSQEKNARAFWRKLVFADNLSKGTALHALHQTLTKRSAAGGAKDRDETVSLILKAWNLHRDKAENVDESFLKLTKAERTTEYPRCGGIDTEPVQEAAPELQDEPGADAAPKKESKAKKTAKTEPAAVA